MLKDFQSLKEGFIVNRAIHQQGSLSSQSISLLLHNLNCPPFWFIELEHIAKLASTSMISLHDIWNEVEADFKPLDVLSLQYGLKDEEFEAFSLMADQF